MAVLEPPRSEVSPLSISCVMCGETMRLILIDPATESTTYAYRCANGHRSEFVALDKRLAQFRNL
jgi:hypothetical protein